VDEPTVHDDVDGEPMEDDDIDGVPMDDEDVDGEPMEEDVDGEPMEEDESHETPPSAIPESESVEKKSSPSRARADEMQAGQARRRPKAVDMFADSDDED
jgi:U2-associated protein SR140